MQSELQGVKEDKLKLQHARVKQKDVVAKLERQLHWAHSIIQQEHKITSSGPKYTAQAHQLNTMAQSGLRDLQDDQAELTKLREQVAKLRSAQASSAGGSGGENAAMEVEAPKASEEVEAAPAPEGEGGQVAASVGQEERKMEADRLVEERNALLAGGMYSEGDPIITTLTEKINMLAV